MHTKKEYRLLLLLVIILSVLGCKEVTSQESKKLNNTVSTAQVFGLRSDVKLSEYLKVAANKAPYNTDEFPDFSSSVGFSFSFDGSDYAESGATGVLISPEWILTVGHNFYDASQDSKPVPVKGIYVIPGNDLNDLSTKYSVEKIVFHPTWKEGKQGFYDGNDICLVKLKKPITNITPAKLVENKEEPIGATMWLSGFGDFSHLTNSTKLTNKHAVENILDRKTESTLKTKDGTNYNTGLLASDFDAPSGKTNSFDAKTIDPGIKTVFGKGISSKEATAFEGTSVPGDSGGPLYIKINGEWRVCGVLSATTVGDSKNTAKDSDLSYGAITLYTRIAAHLDWIQQTMKSN